MHKRGPNPPSASTCREDGFLLMQVNGLSLLGLTLLLPKLLPRLLMFKVRGAKVCGVSFFPCLLNLMLLKVDSCGEFPGPVAGIAATACRRVDFTVPFIHKQPVLFQAEPSSRLPILFAPLCSSCS